MNNNNNDDTGGDDKNDHNHHLMSWSIQHLWILSIYEYHLSLNISKYIGFLKQERWIC
jgi:hypothetical protein